MQRQSIQSTQRDVPNINQGVPDEIQANPISHGIPSPAHAGCVTSAHPMPLAWIQHTPHDFVTNLTRLSEKPEEVLQRGGAIKVNLNMLHCDSEQSAALSVIYKASEQFHRVFSDAAESQSAANCILHENGLDLGALGDLGNGWSKRWSMKSGKGEKALQRVLLQCQSGMSMQACKIKDDARRKEHGKTTNPQNWQRKTPYDFTGCLAHMDLTYRSHNSSVQRITGYLEHNAACKEKKMQRLPAVPLHDHVWQIALRQLNDGATISSIQARNHELIEAKLYHGQNTLDATKANVRYNFLPHDSSRLYRKQAQSLGVNMQKPPEYNVDDWLNPYHWDYKPDLAQAVFHYSGRSTQDERFKICIHTQDMQDACWKYGHEKQVVLDGTFGICDRRILLFIALGIDVRGKGIPLAFFLFSAPTGNHATHAGYDSSILTELLHTWRNSLGLRNGVSFTPKVVITDTDTKERGALVVVWPSVWLLLCKFHVRQCWTNKRKTLLKSGKSFNFPKQQVDSRLKSLEHELIHSENHVTALNRIQDEKMVLLGLKEIPESTAAANSGLVFLEYIMGTWMPLPLWQSWSHFGRIRASQILGIAVQGITPTTNHLEAFNGVLKRKHLHRWQKGGHRIRFDMLIFLLIKHILPAIFTQRDLEAEYYLWLSNRFHEHAGGIDLVQQRHDQAKVGTSRLKSAPLADVPLVWWTQDMAATNVAEARYIVAKDQIGDLCWTDTFTVSATCASSHADIRQAGHQRYIQYLSCYGWGSCTCPSFMAHNGACKHLWAFRLKLPQMRSPFLFAFPETREIAVQIYLSIFGSDHNHSVFDHSGVPQVPRNITAPWPPPDSVTHIMTSISSPDDDNAASATSSDSDKVSSSSSGSRHGGWQEPCASHEALAHQVQLRVEHELTMLLPRLHGLALLVAEAAPTPAIANMPALNELTLVLETLGNSVRRLQNGGTVDNMVAPFRDNGPSQGGFATSNIRTETGRRRLLPPSPERSQKRHRSHAVQ